MDDFDHPPDPGLPPVPHKGRGAVANILHRFSREARVAEDDGWTQEPGSSPQTRLHVDRAKSVISRNDSPDLDFSQSINPYRGCEHGCIYCYARPGHAWLGLSPGLDFETEIFHKPDAVDRLREELARPAYVPHELVIGGVTDAYQPVERQTGLTRQLLGLLLETRHPVSVITKGSLIERDIDLLAEFARHSLCHVSLSLTTLDPALARQLEPRASSPASRLRAMARLAAAGIPVSIFVSPVIPGLTDAELERLLQAGHEHGASSARYAVLRLPHEVAPLFEAWLEVHQAERAARVRALIRDLRGGRLNDSRFGQRMRGEGPLAELFAQRFALACRRLGLADRPPALTSGQFRPPAPPAQAGDQLTLF